jgi:hypothetical protein
MKSIHVILFAVALSGCAANKGLYDWGGYDAVLYNSYKDSTTVASNMQTLELHIRKLEQSKQKVPPGLYADLGTLQLQAGDKEKAQANFRKERELWPESAALMDALINNGAMPKPKQGNS